LHFRDFRHPGIHYRRSARQRARLGVRLRLHNRRGRQSRLGVPDKWGGREIVGKINVGSQPWGVAVTADGSRVYVTNKGSGNVSVIDAYFRHVIATIPVGHEPSGVAVTPDGRYVYVANSADDTVSVIDPVANTVIKTLNVPGFPNGVAADSANRVFVTRQAAGKVSVLWHKALFAEIALSGGPDSQPYGVAARPQADKVYVANSGTGSVSVIDTTSYQEEAVVSLPTDFGLPRPIAVALPPNGDRLWIGSRDNSIVFVMNTANNDVNHRIAMPGGCMPFGLAWTSFVDISSRDQLTLWVALEGCNKVGQFAARYELGKIYALLTDFKNPIAFGQFIGPQPKKPTGATGQTAAPAADPCSVPFDGTVNGDLTVADGQTCEVSNGGQVTGNVTVAAGGNFVLSGAAVGGSVTVDGGGITIGPAATVGGDVLIENIAAGVATDSSVCGTTIAGTLQVEGSAAPVQIGSASPYACAGNKIGGDLVVAGNSAAALVFDNRVTGQLQADSNTGPLDVVGNTVGTTLQCQNNTTLILGGNNTANQKQGQCD
jgi:YVTN family beta-propeller protein